MAQCYLGRPEAVPEGIQSVAKTLVDFQRVHIKSGEKVRVAFRIGELYLNYFDPSKMEYQKFIGSRAIMVGASSRDIRLEKTVKVQ